MTRLASVRRAWLLTVFGAVATLLAAACATGTPASDPTPSAQADCPTWDAEANPKTLPAQSHDITARFSEECVRSFVGEGFVAPDLSPRYTLNAFGLSVDPPSRDFRIFYEPRSTKDPQVLLQLFAHEVYSVPGSSSLTTPGGIVIWVGMGEGGYSGAWSRGDWDYIAVALDTKAKHDDIMSQIADAVFADATP